MSLPTYTVCMMPRSQWSLGRLLPGLAVAMAVVLSGVAARPPGDRASQLQLEAVKKSLLEQLGLERPPVVKEALDLEGLQKARRVYREMLAQLRANQTAGAEFPPAGPGTAVHFLRAKLNRVAEGPLGSLEAAGGLHGHLYSLELSRTATLHRNLRVLRVELQLFKEALNLPDISKSNSTWSTQIHIYKFGDGDTTSPQRLASYVLSRTSPTLDLRDAVDPWVASTEPRLLLGLQFPADVTIPEGTGTLPLEVVTQERVRVRKARQLDEECGKGDRKCCLQSLKVSFEAIGWSDWVVAPSSYSMKFCKGSCPHNYKPANIHAQIKARLHSLSGETPAPCCVPAAYEPMVIMHVGSEDKLVTQVFQDMIVTRCHCA